MNNNTLPTDDLKKHGIINEDFTFSKKLSADDVQRFLQGYTIVADNATKRATFQLIENNTRLKVIFLERDKSLSKILEKTKEKIQYSETKGQYEIPQGKNSAQLNFSKQAFVYDRETGTVKELDLIKNAAELTQIIVERKNPDEITQYKSELEKLKNLLYDKMDNYPEIAKEISNDLNIVDREINSILPLSATTSKVDNDHYNGVQLSVNDPDLFVDENRQKEEEQEEEVYKSKGRGR
ncbi:hypothetical protein [Chryseobacterium culicis]|uniref:Uncharacterized protein n=1 Tax=Chryseobacterium culicis TaxID=680127 RepID=A0A1H6H745_CHRCI|nr:hypothetical protein [Chryseobacterium culicis]SEH29878.1 hypothetical protein SAMN05421593_1206 [Chryseobacterium culicis]